MLLMAGLLTLTPSISRGQTVKAFADTNYVEFGSPVTLTITAETEPGRKVTPKFINSKYIVPTLDIVGDIMYDTLSGNNGKLLHRFTMRITSFEDSTYTIEPLVVMIDTTQYYTNGLSITFTLLQGLDSAFLAGIDTTKSLKIFDVKDVKQTPWTFNELWTRFGNIILIILIAAILASIITYVVIRKIRNKPIIPILKPREPAENVALRRLQQLREKKLCAAGNTKEYYTELTEILKTYISDRYGTSVLESTSAETMQVLNEKIGRKSEAWRHMDYIFGIADFVKFAKMQPLPDENDKAMSLAFDFVEITKPVLQSADNQKQ